MSRPRADCVVQTSDVEKVADIVEFNVCNRTDRLAAGLCGCRAECACSQRRSGLPRRDNARGTRVPPARACPERPSPTRCRKAALCHSDSAQRVPSAAHATIGQSISQRHPTRSAVAPWPVDRFRVGRVSGSRTRWATFTKSGAGELDRKACWVCMPEHYSNPRAALCSTT